MLKKKGGVEGKMLFCVAARRKSKQEMMVHIFKRGARWHPASGIKVGEKMTPLIS